MESVQNNQEEDLKRAETLLQQAKPNIELTIFDESTIAALKDTMGLFEKWEVEEKMAEVYQYWGLYLFEKEDFENAKIYYQKSLDFRLRMYGEKHEQVGETYLSLGNLHTTLNDFSTAKKHLDKAMEISLALFGEQHLLTSKCYDGISGLLFEEEKHYESIKYQEKALEIAENLDHCPLFYMGKLYTNIGVDYSSVSNYYLSKHYLEKASSIFQRILPPTHKQFGAIYYTLSNAHRNTLNYNMALVFKQKALAVFESEPTNYLYAAYAYNGLQGLYVQLNKPEQAIEVGQKALQLLDRIGMRENGLTVAVLLNLGGNYGEHKKNLEKSLVYLQEALQKAITIYGPESSYVANVYVRIGRSYRDNNQYSKALTHLEKALEISEKLNDSHSVLRIEIIREISNIYFFRTNPDYLLSLQYLHQEYSFSLEGYDNKDIYDFPFLDIQKNPFKIRTSQEALLQTIKDHAFVFFDYYRYVTKALKDLEASHKGFGIAIRMADYSRQSFQLEASKLVISKKMQVAMRRAFRVVHTLYEVTNREAYLQDAFKLAEKDKAYLLLLAHQEKNKAEIFNSANALLKTETLLKNKLTGLQKNIQFQEQKENEGLLRQYQNEYFDASVEFEALKKRIKKEHPVYYNQTYSTETVTIETLQSTLAENQTVLSYFIGEEKIYLFAVTPDEYEVFALDKPDNWEGLIQRYLQSIKFNQKDTFQQLSFELYQILLQEAVHHLIDPFEEEAKQVFIIPHNELHYLPFETLLISEADTSTPYNELDYLLNHCQISYHYSATLLQLDLQKQNNAIAESAPPDFAFTGFAPVYESTSDNQKLAIQQLQNKEEAYATAVNRSEAVRSDGTWMPLPYSKIEVENIVQLFEKQGHKSQQFLYESATKNNLEQQIGKSRFVLIAAHGIVNDDYPELSGLVLADDGGGEQEFGVSEESLDLVTNSPSFEKHGDIKNGNEQKTIEDCILNMKEVAMIPMSADLVVLSSCESGIGELHKGEGMMAVNRGFLASGAKNVVSTLFKVNDKASSELTQLLFVHILKGENYSVALQKAKLELLEREKMSPKMWSGFVLFGKGE